MYQDVKEYDYQGYGKTVQEARKLRGIALIDYGIRTETDEIQVQAIELGEVHPPIIFVEVTQTELGIRLSDFCIKRSENILSTNTRANVTPLPLPANVVRLDNFQD